MNSAQIHVFEDLTNTMVNFMKFMKQDNRINGVWTRDGNLLYQWKNSERVEKTTSLYEGVAQLGYTVKDVMNCFVNKSDIFKGESGSIGT